MFRKITISAVSALVLASGAAFGEGAQTYVHDIDFAHEGVFGKFDKNQLQRGLQVYTEVCSACHGMQFVPIRTLADDGGPQLPEDQVRAYAKQFTVVDAETGEDREGLPTDHFPHSGMETAPDLSLMAKARAAYHGPYGTGISQLFNGIGGSEYLASILIGYEEAPACAPEDVSGYYNTAFPNGGVPEACKDEHGVSTVPGSWIAMPSPLSEGLVEYADGHEASVENMAEDVASFLTWAAEPKLVARKQNGFTAVFLLALLASLLYVTNKRIWAGVKGKKKTS